MTRKPLDGRMQTTQMVLDLVLSLQDLEIMLVDQIRALMTQVSLPIGGRQQSTATTLMHTTSVGLDKCSLIYIIQL